MIFLNRFLISSGEVCSCEMVCPVYGDYFCPFTALSGPDHLSQSKEVRREP